MAIRKYLTSKQGFTYIEVVCWVVILGIIIPPLLSLILKFTNINQQAKENQKVAYNMQNMMEEVKERLTEIVEEPCELNDLKEKKNQVQKIESFFEKGLWEEFIREKYKCDKYIYEIGIWEVVIPYKENLKDTFGEWIKLSSIEGEILNQMGYRLEEVVKSEKMMLEWIRINGSNRYYNLLAPIYQRDTKAIQGKATIKWFEQTNQSSLIDQKGIQRQELPLQNEVGKWGSIIYDETEESYILKINEFIVEGKVEITIDLGKIKKDKAKPIVKMINQSNCDLLVKVMLANKPEDFSRIDNLVEIQNPYKETVLTYYQQKNITANPFIIGIIVRNNQENKKEEILGQMMDIYLPKAR